MHPPQCGEELTNQSYLTAQTGHSYPQNSPGRTGGTRAYLPLCGEDLEVQSYPTPHGASLSPKTPGRIGGSWLTAPLCGEELVVQSYPTPPTVRPYPPNGPCRTTGTRVYLPLCGEELKDYSYLTPETGRPCPPNGPGRTGGTRVYLPPCGEELETQSYTAPPWGVPIPQTAQAGPEGLGCIRRCVGRSRKFNQIRTHMDHPYPPYDEGRTRVSPTLCGEELEVQSIPTSPYTPNGGGMSTGTPLYPPVCGEYPKTQL